MYDKIERYVSRHCRCSLCGKHAFEVQAVEASQTKRGDRWGTYHRVFVRCNNCRVESERTVWFENEHLKLPGFDVHD